MSFRLYKARLKCLVRNKENMFWNYLFPILLSTCFYFAFTNLWTVESFETIKIAYVNTGDEQDVLKEVLEQTVIDNDKKMFTVTYCSKEEASEMLEDGKIKAYIVGSTEPELFVKGSGMNETILKTFLDSYRRMTVTTQTILTGNPEALNQGLMQELMQSQSFVEEKVNEKNPDAVLIYFYALLAMTCLFASNWGLEEVINIQADQSVRGARVNVSPVSKMKLFISNMLASYTIHVISIILLFVYMDVVLKVKFGSNIFFIFANCMLGSLTGLLLGAVVGVLIKKKENVKQAVLTSIVMVGSFLSGLMLADMKYFVATKAPFLNYINPVSLVADSFYSLYYYDTYDRFLLNTAILCFMVLLMGTVSYFGLRRKSYASI